MNIISIVGLSTLIFFTQDFFEMGGGFYRPSAGITITADQFLKASQSNFERVRKIDSKFGGSRKFFSNFTCKSAFLATPVTNRPKINLIAEVHGNDEAKETTRASMSDALAGRSILLLESDSRFDVGLERTLSRFGFNGLNKRIQPLDTNQDLRTIWFSSIFMSSVTIENTDVSSLMLANTFIESPYKLLFGPSVSKEINANSTSLLELEMSVIEELSRNEKMSDILRTIGSHREIKGKYQRIIRHLLNESIAARRNVNYLLEEPATPSFTAKEFYSLFYEVRSILLEELVNLELLPQTQDISEEDFMFHVGFNLRDEVFLDEIGYAICDSIEIKNKTINVIIGAGHVDGLKNKIVTALSSIGEDSSDIVNVFSASRRSAPTSN